MQKNTNKKPLKVWQKILIVAGILLGIIILAAAILILVLSLTEFKPDDEESVTIDPAQTESEEMKAGDEFTLLSWNVGFAAQGEDTDCFLDGGSQVIPTDEAGVRDNLAGIASIIAENDPDILFLQEVDIDSKRSHNIDEYEALKAGLAEYAGSFALNYSTLYVPYPFPTTYGKVNAGLAVFTKAAPSSSTRISLPCPFTWPMSTVNLKRCLLVERIPIADSDKELVLINLHLEAYDDGEGKAAQTRQLCDLLQHEAEKGNYVIAAGDFNQTFSNCDTSAYPVLGDNWVSPIIEESDFGSDFTLLMDSTVPSCRSLDKVYAGADQDPSAFQYYMLDGFIVSANITIENMETLDEGFVYTDHNPILLDVTLQ